MSNSVEDVVGYRVTTLGVQSCVADVVAWIANEQDADKVGQCRWLACMNPHSYAVALNDALFSQALHAADWLVADGTGELFADWGIPTPESIRQLAGLDGVTVIGSGGVRSGLDVVG